MTLFEGMREAGIESDGQITVVLPIKRHVHHRHCELERVQRVLFPSMRKFFDISDLRETLLIVPAQDLEAVRAGVGSFAGPLRIRVLQDEDLTPFVTRFARGWVRQQVLKLSAANCVRTAQYLVLDSDNLFVGPTSLSVLFKDGLPRITREPIRIHRRWWRGSARTLRYAWSLESESLGLGVTPQILHTRIVRELMVEIETRNQRAPWEEVLRRRRRWTEFTLYWLFLTRNHAAEELYDLEGEPLHLNGVWHDASELTQSYVDRLFRNPSCPLSVIQSRIPDLSVSEVADRVAPYLEYAQGDEQRGGVQPDSTARVPLDPAR